MSTITNEELEQDKAYMLNKRNEALTKLNESVTNSDSLEKINNRFNGLIRKHKQWLLINDALLVHKLIRENK